MTDKDCHPRIVTFYQMRDTEQAKRVFQTEPRVGQAECRPVEPFGLVSHYGSYGAPRQRGIWIASYIAAFSFKKSSKEMLYLHSIGCVLRVEAHAGMVRIPTGNAA